MCFEFTVYGEVMEFWAQRVQTTMDSRSGWVVVDDRYDTIDDVTDFLLVLQHGRGRSEGTARAYAGRIALFLTWAVSADVDWRRPSPVQLTVFMGWLTRTPSRRHRLGRRRRQAPPLSMRREGPQRSAGTVNGILTAVVEFLRHLGSYDVIDEDVPGRLSQVRRVRVAAGEGWNESPSRAVDARVLRQRHVAPVPKTLTVAQQEAVRVACGNERDRFIVEVFADTGMRVGEACGRVQNETLGHRGRKTIRSTAADDCS